MIKGLGYRQRAILAALHDADRPLPTGYLRRQVLDDCDPRTLHVALNGLAARGLAERARWGMWRAS